MKNLLITDVSPINCRSSSGLKLEKSDSSDWDSEPVSKSSPDHPTSFFSVTCSCWWSPSSYLCRVNTNCHQKIGFARVASLCIYSPLISFSFLEFLEYGRNLWRRWRNILVMQCTVGPLWGGNPVATNFSILSEWNTIGWRIYQENPLKASKWAHS